VINDLFERCGSVGRVAIELANRGVMQPKRSTVTGNVRGGRPFQKQQLLRILRNPVYLGTIAWGEAVREDAHAAIIDPEQFARVGRRLEETQHRRSNFRNSGNRTYTLSGLLRCSCGSHLVGASYPGRSKKRYRYYVCTKQQHEATRESCQAPRIPANDLERAVQKRLIDIGNRDEARQAIIDAAAIMVTGRRGELDSQAADLRQRILSNKSERSKLLEVLKVGGASALLSVRDELERLEEEAANLEHSLAALAQEQAPLDEQEAAARTFLESWAASATSSPPPSRRSFGRSSSTTWR
jgi:site-specific DNA recombinase